MIYRGCSIHLDLKCILMKCVCVGWGGAGGGDEFWAALHHPLKMCMNSKLTEHLMSKNTDFIDDHFHGVRRFHSISLSLESLIIFLEPGTVALVSINNIKKRRLEDVFQILRGLIEVFFQKTFTDSITLRKIIPFFCFSPDIFILKFLILFIF